MSSVSNYTTGQPVNWETPLQQREADAFAQIDTAKEEGFEPELRQIAPGTTIPVFEGIMRVEWTCTTYASQRFAILAEQFARFACQHRHELTGQPQEMWDKIKTNWPNLSQILVSNLLHYKCGHEILNKNFYQQLGRSFPKDIEALVDMAYAYQMLGNQAKSNSKKEEQIFFYHKALFCALMWHSVQPDDLKGEILLARSFWSLIYSESDRVQLYTRTMAHAEKAASLSSPNDAIRQLPERIARNFYYRFIESKEVSSAFECILDLLQMPDRSTEFDDELVQNLFSFTCVLDHSQDAIVKVLNFFHHFLPKNPKYNGFRSAFVHEFHCMTRNVAKARENLDLLPASQLKNLYELQILLKENKLEEFKQKYQRYVKTTKASDCQVFALLGEFFELSGSKQEALNNYELAIVQTIRKKGARNSWLLAKCRLLLALGPEVMLKHDIEATLNLLAKNGASHCIDYRKAAAAFAIVPSTAIESSLAFGKKYVEKHPEEEDVGYGLIGKLILSSRIQQAQAVAATLFVSRQKDATPRSYQRDLKLAETLVTVGLRNEAVTCFNKYLKNQRNEEVCSFEIYLLNEVRHHGLGIERGIAYLTTYPRSSGLNAAVAACHFYLKNYTEALKYANAAVDCAMRGVKDNDKKAALIMRMKIFLKQNNSSKALRDFNALKTFQAVLDIETIEELFHLYLTLKQTKEAKALIDNNKKILGDEYEKLKKELPQQPKPVTNAELPKPKAAPASLPLAKAITRETDTTQEAPSPYVKNEKAPAEASWQGTKRMQEEARIMKLDKFFQYRSSNPLFFDQIKLQIEAKPCRYFYDEYTDEELEIKTEPPSETTTTPPQQYSLIPGDLEKTERELQELKLKKAQAERQASLVPVKKVFPTLSASRKYRLICMQTSLVSLGDFPKRIGDFAPQFQGYLFKRVLAYNFIKCGEVAHSTSNRIPLDHEFLEIGKAFFINPTLALKLRTEARHEFERVSIPKLIHCSETLYHPDLMSNLENCLSSANDNLFLAPAVAFPHDLTLLEEKSAVSTRLQVIEELQWLIKMSKDEKVMRILHSKEAALTSEYTFAARMSISNIMTGFRKLGIFSKAYQWLAQYSQAIGHEVEAIDDVTVPEILLVISQAKALLHDFAPEA